MASSTRTGDRVLFEWDWFAPSGLHVKDFICPSSFRFRGGKAFLDGRQVRRGILLTDNRPGNE